MLTRLLVLQVGLKLGLQMTKRKVQGMMHYAACTVGSSRKCLTFRDFQHLTYYLRQLQ